MLTPGGMYAPETNLNGTMRHSRHCKGTFDHRDPRCQRCVQLKRGAAPRKGWAKRPIQNQKVFQW